MRFCLLSANTNQQLVATNPQKLAQTSLLPDLLLNCFSSFFSPSSLVHFGGFLLFYSVYAVVKLLLLLPVFKISQNMEQNLATVLWPKQQTTINPRLTKTSRNICQRNRPGAKKHVKRALR